MANPDQFARRFVRIAGGVVKGAARVVRNTSITAISAVTGATPVDTTRARSNWIASLGQPDLSERSFRSKQDVVSEARTTLNLDLIEQQIFARDVVEVHIANGGDKVQYLEWLNKGSSRQAPAGFVRIAMDIARVKMKGSRSKLLTFVRGSVAKGI